MVGALRPKAKALLAILLWYPWGAAAQVREEAVGSGGPLPSALATDAPRQESEPPPWVARRPERMNLLLPIVESEALHFMLTAANNLVLREHFAQISADSIVSHFDGRRPWEFDVDSFEINQFGHPYQGALSFTAARSSGLAFWWAALYPTLSSLTWELFFEIDAPAVNDQITTPIGGIFLGEVLHRSALLLLREGSAPRWLRAIEAFLVDPMGQINRALLDGQLDAQDVADSPQVFWMLGGGMNVGSAFRDPNTLEVVRSVAPQGNVQGRMTYGMPGDPTFSYQSPFSHFDLDFNLSFTGVPLSTFFIRGLLGGGRLGAGATSGLWGLFGQYDFAAASVFRVSAVGLGMGVSLQTRLPFDLTLQFSGLASGMPFASAGNLGLGDGSPVRDYHIGPGAQATLEARLIWNDRAWLRAVGRSWFCVGAYVDPLGWESISYLTAGPMVRIWGPVALGADVTFAARRAQFDDGLFDRNLAGATARLSLNWVSSESLGAVKRPSERAR